MTQPIRKSITVPLPRDEAFELFTAGIDSWWPKDRHSVSASTNEGDKAEVRIDPREGGHVIERRADGTEEQWATVRNWVPGHRLTLDWYPGRGNEEATEVEIVFQQTETGTRIDLTHSGFGRFGRDAETMCTTYDSGWDHVFGVCYRSRCRAHAA